MEQNKQTAVEWLEDKFDKFLAYYEGHHKAEPYSIVELSNDFFKAKEIEKLQIIEAYCFGCKDIIENQEIFPRETSEQYYNEEYGK